jgi:integrase
MPHYPKPFFRVSRNTWFVEIDGRQFNLGHHPKHLRQPSKRDDGWDPPREILEAYHREVARRGQPHTLSINLGQGPAVVEVLDTFLDWLQKRVQEGRKEPRTYDWYRGYLQSFTDSISDELTCAQLAPIHVYQWVDAHPGWKTGKRGAMVAVQRAFTWAAKAGLMKALGGVSPLASLEKPPQGKRGTIIPPAEFEAILSQVRNQAFKNLCIVAYETGCRPHEILTVEAHHVDLQNSSWVFPPDEAKGKKFFRVVYLSERALEITKRLLAEHPEGKLFRNSDGRPWHPYDVNCAFGRVQVALGKVRLKKLGFLEAKLERLTADQRRHQVLRQEHERDVKARRVRIEKLARKYGRRFCLYNLRHSWATRALQNGVDPVTVSVLMGHADASMLARVYQHLAHDPEYLRGAARKARGA